MNGIHFEENLSPLKDGIVSQKEDIDQMSRHAVLIGTNGRYRLLSMKEAENILESMKDCSATMFLNDGNYALIYNTEKTFYVDGTRFLAGSFLVLKMEGQRMVPISDREIGRLFVILAGRMEELRAGGEVFDALEID
jgi:PHD/YefM family antitoxin component YafN of YafNO toxin-antitoxin module